MTNLTYRQNSLGQPINEEEITLLTEDEIEEHIDQIDLSEPKKDKNDGLKYILYFTSYFHMKDYQFGFGQEPFEKFGCEVTNCFATNNKTYLGKKFRM